MTDIMTLNIPDHVTNSEAESTPMVPVEDVTIMLNTVRASMNIPSFDDADRINQPDVTNRLIILKRRLMVRWLTFFSVTAVLLSVMTLYLMADKTFYRVYNNPGCSLAKEKCNTTTCEMNSCTTNECYWTKYKECFDRPFCDNVVWECSDVAESLARKNFMADSSNELTLSTKVSNILGGYEMFNGDYNNTDTTLNFYMMTVLVCFCMYGWITWLVSTCVAVYMLKNDPIIKPHYETHSEYVLKKFIAINTFCGTDGQAA